MPKGKSWAGAEEKCLCHAWLRASEDPITGTGQKKDSFWNAIVRQFIKLLPAGELSATEHSTSPMQARWALINKEFIILLLVEFYFSYSSSLSWLSAMASMPHPRIPPAVFIPFLRYRVCIHGTGWEHTGLTTLYVANFYRVRL